MVKHKLRPHHFEGHFNVFSLESPTNCIIKIVGLSLHTAMITNNVQHNKIYKAANIRRSIWYLFIIYL